MPSTLRSPAEVAQAERDSGPRKRRKPERLANQQPATFDVEREVERRRSLLPSGTRMIMKSEKT